MVGGCLDEAENVFELEEVRTTPTGVAFASDDASMKVAAKINGPATAATLSCRSCTTSHGTVLWKAQTR